MLSSISYLLDTLQKKLSSFIFYFSGTRHWNHSFSFGKQVLWYWAIAPAPKVRFLDLSCFLYQCWTKVSCTKRPPLVSLPFLLSLLSQLLLPALCSLAPSLTQIRHMHSIWVITSHPALPLCLPQFHSLLTVCQELFFFFTPDILVGTH